jgi:hypothetical protein
MPLGKLDSVAVDWQDRKFDGDPLGSMVAIRAWLGSEDGAWVGSPEGSGDGATES